MFEDSTRTRGGTPKSQRSLRRSIDLSETIASEPMQYWLHSRTERTLPIYSVCASRLLSGLTYQLRGAPPPQRPSRSASPARPPGASLERRVGRQCRRVEQHRDDDG